MTKYLELRDRGTFIPVMVTKPEPANAAERYLLGRAGYRPPENYVLFTELSGLQTHHDPHKWAGRTFFAAHRWLVDHFDEVENGAVIDVEFILGETSVPKTSERFFPLDL